MTTRRGLTQGIRAVPSSHILCYPAAVTPPAPTRRLHRDEPLRLTFAGRVVAHAEWEDRPSVVLAETAFYPESGGQNGDHGGELMKAITAASGGRGGGRADHAEGRLPLGTDFAALVAAIGSIPP